MNKEFDTNVKNVRISHRSKITIAENQLVINVKYVRISDSTNALLECYAQILDIRESVSNILKNSYCGQSVDNMMQGYYTANAKLASELMKVISNEMDDNLLDTDFKEL